MHMVPYFFLQLGAFHLHLKFFTEILSIFTSAGLFIYLLGGTSHLFLSAWHTTIVDECGGASLCNNCTPARRSFWPALFRCVLRPPCLHTRISSCPLVCAASLPRGAQPHAWAEHSLTGVQTLPSTSHTPHNTGKKQQQQQRVYICPRVDLSENSFSMYASKQNSWLIRQVYIYFTYKRQIALQRGNGYLSLHSHIPT